MTFTLVGFAESVAVGVGVGVVTVTCTLLFPDPPLPVQVNANCVVCVRLATASVPEGVFVPDQALDGVLDAVHVVAFVLDQVKVTDPGETTLVEDEDSVTVGAGVVPGSVGGGVSPPPLPPPPHPASTQAVSDAKVRLMENRDVIERSGGIHAIRVT